VAAEYRGGTFKSYVKKSAFSALHRRLPAKSLFATKETVSSIIPAFSSGYLALPGCTFGLPHPELGFRGEHGAEPLSHRLGDYPFKLFATG